MMRDFYGFQFNGFHSSDLGIVRVSDGSRYNDSLVPAFQDKTAQRVGNDGTFYWESFYTNKPIAVQIAFDNLSEIQYRKLRQVFDGKAEGDLIFDETPYKAYYVKVQNPPQLKTICFNDYYEEGGQEKVRRVYKGEGTINFICYNPYARGLFKYLDGSGQTPVYEVQMERAIFATRVGDPTNTSFYLPPEGTPYADYPKILVPKSEIDKLAGNGTTNIPYNDNNKQQIVFYYANPGQSLLNAKKYISYKRPWATTQNNSVFSGLNNNHNPWFTATRSAVSSNYVLDGDVVRPIVTNYYSNKDEWLESSGVLSSNILNVSGSTILLDVTGTSSINIYNAGDVATDWCAYFSSGVNSITFKPNANDNFNDDVTTATLTFTNMPSPTTVGGTYIRVNSKTQLVEVCDSYFEPTGVLFNKYISGGDFFRIPVSPTPLNYYKVTSDANIVKFDYNYLYY